jgi:hypothetical protein
MSEKREKQEMDKLAEHMPTRDHPTATDGATVPKLISFIRRMKAAQETDTYCIAQKANLAAGGQEGQPPTRQFKTAAGLLWHIAEGRYQLVTPAQPAALREITLQECHDVPFAGHLGVHKTLARRRSRFWWVGMAEDGKDYVKTCHQYQATKLDRRTPAGELHCPIPPVRRWQEVNVDFVTGLRLTPRDKDAIMTVSDKASKQVHLVPLNFKGSSAEPVARLYVDNVWSLHGMPMTMYSDRDSRFTSAFWKEVAKLTGMMSGMTTAYHPQGNGSAERPNQTMEQILRAYTEPIGTDWDSHLSAVRYAMNDSVHSSTGEKPFVLMYGESPCTQLDWFIEAAHGEKVVNPTAFEFVCTWKRHLRAAQELMRVKQGDMFAQFNMTKRTPVPFIIGQTVMLSAKAITSPGDTGTKWKLRDQWYGRTSDSDWRETR